MQKSVLPIFFMFPMILFHESYAGRPFLTEDAPIVAPSSFELEAGAEFAASGKTGSFELRHGITDRMDMAVAIGLHSAPHDSATVVPATLNLKYMIIPEMLTAAFTGSFSEGSFSALMAVSQPVKNATLHFNVGAILSSKVAHTDYLYGFAVTMPVKKMIAGIEIFGDSENGANVQVGSQFQVMDGVCLDAGLGKKLCNKGELFFNTGIWIEFPAIKNQPQQ